MIEQTNGVDDDDLIELTSMVVAAYVRNHRLATAELTALIKTVAKALRDCGRVAPAPAPEVREPPVPIRKSVQPDYIVCLEDGKKLKMLKRYLRTRFGMTPDQYREKWRLPPDYPMVAPNYTARRSEFAKSIGLGRGGRPRE